MNEKKAVALTIRIVRRQLFLRGKVYFVFSVCLGKQYPVVVMSVQNIHHRMGSDAPAAVHRTIILERIRFRTGEIQTNQPIWEG